MSQKILVAGSGKSGIAASRMALDTEHEVILYDSNEALDAEAVRGQFKEDATIAVSYTHLDVYKRQNQKSAGQREHDISGPIKPPDCEGRCRVYTGASDLSL